MKLRECLQSDVALLSVQIEQMRELAEYLEELVSREDLPDVEVGWSVTQPRWISFYSVPDVLGAARELSAYLGLQFKKWVNQGDGDIVAHCYEAPAPLGQIHLEGSPGPSCTVERIVKGTKIVEDVEFKVTGCDGLG